MILCSVGPGSGALEIPKTCAGLSQAGHEVEILLEQGADKFIGPAAFSEFATVTNSPSRTPEAILFAPCTAEVVSRLANGLENGPATEAYFSGVRPTILIPQLDKETGRHPAVRKNIESLKEAGCRVLEKAIDETLETAEVVSFVLGSLSGPLDGVSLLVSAGGTREPIDSVRFIGNRSSGKMGLAIAREAVRMGADVTVVAANLEAREPGTRWISVETVEELRQTIVEEASRADALVMAAAVSDFTPTNRSETKMRRGEGLSLELTATADVLKAVRSENPDLFMVGFAATHGDPVPDAREKLSSKGVNMVVGNDISQQGIGFGSEENEVHVVREEGERFVPKTSKQEVARVILDELAKEIEMEAYT